MGSILPCCLPCGKAGGPQILCCQGIKVTDYNFTLDAWALKPSGFCSVRLRSESGTGYFIIQDESVNNFPEFIVRTHFTETR
jgi:hypothetical protein